MKLYKFENILNEIATVFDMDQWDDQVNTFTDVIKSQLDSFIYSWFSLKNGILASSIRLVNANYWNLYKDYRDKFYINGRKIKIEQKPSNRCGYLNYEDVRENDIKYDEYGRAYIEICIENLNDCKNTAYMFAGIYNLKKVPNISFNNIHDFWYMFASCDGLVKVGDITGLETIFNNSMSSETLPMVIERFTRDNLRVKTLLYRKSEDELLKDELLHILFSGSSIKEGDDTRYLIMTIPGNYPTIKFNEDDLKKIRESRNRMVKLMMDFRIKFLEFKKNNK